MIRRLYVHNFRCLENFELPISGRSSALLIGKNGAGKTTVGLALRILQQIARGTNRVGDLVTPNDLARGRTDVPLRVEIEVELGGRIHGYSIALEYPKGFKELRVYEENLAVDGNLIYTRHLANVSLARTGKDKEAAFHIDWHLLALPIIQQQSKDDPVFLFRQWLARMMILQPIPSLILGDSREEILEPNFPCTNFGAWFAGLLAYAPSAYSRIDQYLREVMPDLKDIKNPNAGADARSLIVQFSNEQGSLTLPFKDLSDGEKCFMICALVLATKEAYSSAFCFWDEPDNYLDLSEVGHFVIGLRKAFQSGGQFLATSHNPESIRSFSSEDILVLYRNSHLEPTVLRPLSELQVTGDVVNAWTRGDVAP